MAMGINLKVALDYKNINIKTHRAWGKLDKILSCIFSSNFFFLLLLLLAPCA
jgi:hypothetical protein